MIEGGFEVTVIGSITARSASAPPRRLSPASRHLLAVLVAAGPKGLSAADLAWERDPKTPPSDQAVRMTAARLRRHLDVDVLPRADDGNYRLASPVDHVDAWALADLAGRPGAPIDLHRFRHVLVNDAAFGDVPASELLETASREIRGHQRDLLIELARTAPDVLTGDLVEAMVRHVEDNPLDDRLVYQAALAVSRSGRKTQALKLIGRARLSHREAGLDLDERLADLEQRLLTGSSTDVQPPRARTGAGAVLNPLRAQLTGTYIGDRSELTLVQSLLDNHEGGLTAVLLSGASGSGKTRVCAEAVQHAIDTGWPVVSILPSTLSDQTPFAPLIAALPELVEPIARVIASDADADSARFESWRLARAALDSRRVNGALVISVDDTQWLDDATAEFLAHFVTSTVEGSTVLLMNGRNDVAQSARWAQLRDRIDTVGATTIEVEPLSPSDIRDLVDDLRPRLTGPLLEALGNEIHQHSAGLPGVARLLLASVPEGSAVLANIDSADRNAPLTPVLASLSDRALRVGLAAAVVGPRFGFDALHAASDLADDVIFDGLDELVDHELVSDVSLSDFELAHTLVERGLISASSRRSIADTHRRAATHFADDVHRNAHHLARALPTVDAHEAIQALRKSAMLAMTERSYRLAIRQFEDVQSLSDGALTARELGAFARALDLSGMHDASRTQRARGFEMAAQTGDWSAALAIATSGLPEVEPIDGELSVAEQLRRIDVSAISDREAWLHACHAARQLTIVGDVESALDFAARTVVFARTAEERVGAALARRFCVSTYGTPADGIAAMEAVRDDIDAVDQSLQADYRFNLALERQRGGEFDSARAELDHFSSMPIPSAVKSWHAMMMGATFAFDLGEFNRARRLRSDAHAFAVNSGLGEADNALLASTFVDMWLSGTLSLLIDEVDGGVLDPSHRHLTNAAAAAVLFEAGQVDRAGQLAEDAVATARNVIAPQTIAILAVVSSALAATADESKLEWVSERFAAVGDSMLVLGASAANLGPVTRFQARVAPDDVSRLRLLERARDLADRSGSLLWRAITRHDLVEAGQSQWAPDLAALVTGSEVASIVAGPVVA